GDRLAWLDRRGQLWAQSGNLRAPALLQAEAVERFALAGTRLLAYFAGGWQLKTGSLYAPWTPTGWANAGPAALTP
ncbi:MAG: hypothetical protein ACKOC5_02330, partial [Chloroflexota bacterium]